MQGNEKDMKNIEDTEDIAGEPKNIFNIFSICNILIFLFRKNNVALRLVPTANQKHFQNAIQLSRRG